MSSKMSTKVGPESEVYKQMKAHVEAQTGKKMIHNNPSTAYESNLYY